MSNKNRRLNVSYIVNFLPTLQSNFKGMDKPIFKLITLIEADEFLASLPNKAREKVLYNIRKVRFGVKDPELFCKLDNDIWEFRTAYQGKKRTRRLPYVKNGLTIKINKIWHN